MTQATSKPLRQRKLERLTEACTGYDRIDKTAGIIYGVRVAGNVSRNGRKYRQDAFARGKHLYEGSAVNIDHQLLNGNTAKPRAIRSFRDRWGKLVNVREAAGGGLEADLHFLVNHDQTPVILEAAERMPETFGLSHDASGEVVHTRDGDEVVEIRRVNSVDLVGTPATTNGLFESEGHSIVKSTFSEISKNGSKLVALLEDMMTADPSIADMPVDYADESSAEDQVKAAFREVIMTVIDDESLDMASMLDKIKALLTAKEQAVTTLAGDKTTSAPAADGTVQEEESVVVSNLREELENTKRELTQVKTRTTLRALLESSNRAVTDIRLNALCAVKESDRKALIEEWPEVAKGSGKRPATSPSVLQESVQGSSYAKDSKDFQSRLR